MSQVFQMRLCMARGGHAMTHTCTIRFAWFCCFTFSSSLVSLFSLVLQGPGRAKVYLLKQTDEKKSWISEVEHGEEEEEEERGGTGAVMQERYGMAMGRHDMAYVRLLH